MKKRFTFFILLSIIGLNSAFTQTSVIGGVVSGTWTLAGSPYLIQGSIMIADGTTLTIEPGVIVNFQGAYKLLVLGRLLAIGTTIDTISFTAADTTNGWRGIRFNKTTNNNDTSKVIYCKLQYSKATSTSPDNNGGAFYFNNFSKAIISNCHITNCTANSGGAGIYCSNSGPSITYNFISNNSSSGDFLNSGGGITCVNGSNPIIANNEISNNKASYSGGVFCESSNPIITNNIIFNNSSSIYGGGIYCSRCSPSISYNNISNNHGDFGGGISCFGSSPSITNNIISNNNTASESHGGGIYCGCYSTMSSNPVITNNTISNNSASNGGALYCDCNSNPTLRNTILWGNRASTSGSQVYLADESSDPNFYYCDVQGGTAAFGLNGNFYIGTYQNNINIDPLLVSPSGGSGTSYNGVTADWSLQNGSPCINTGDPNGSYPSTDKAGNPRVYACQIDIGAFEYQNVSQPVLTVSTNNLTIAAQANSIKTFDITSNFNWTAASNENWLTVSNSTGSCNATITLIATANPTIASRMATVTVSGIGVSAQTITVTQDGAVPVLTVSTNTLTIAAPANSTKSFDITSNISWTAASNQTWLTVSSASGSGNATITLTATANPTTATRTAAITVSGTGVTAQTVEVNQAEGETSVNEVENTIISIYPNPTNTTLFISNIGQKATISIFDLQGKLIYNKPIINNQLDISKLSSGEYTLQIICDNRVITKKLIKK